MLQALYTVYEVLYADTVYCKCKLAAALEWHGDPSRFRGPRTLQGTQKDIPGRQILSRISD